MVMDAESQRLSALHALGILDSPQHESFDRLTSMVCRVLKVPIALIAFADRDRVWFKSNSGLMRDITQIHNEKMICRHVFKMDETDVMVVHDASKDPSLKENMIVTEFPFARFVVAVPITIVHNDKVGCVSDFFKIGLFDSAIVTLNTRFINLELYARSTQSHGLFSL